LYDILLHNQHKQRVVTTVIIYSAGVKRREVMLDFKTLVYKPHVIFLEEKNGDELMFDTSRENTLNRLEKMKKDFQAEAKRERKLSVVHLKKL